MEELWQPSTRWLWILMGWAHPLHPPMPTLCKLSMSQLPTSPRLAMSHPTPIPTPTPHPTASRGLPASPRLGVSHPTPILTPIPHSQTSSRQHASYFITTRKGQPLPRMRLTKHWQLYPRWGRWWYLWKGDFFLKPSQDWPKLPWLGWLCHSCLHCWLCHSVCYFSLTASW